MNYCGRLSSVRILQQLTKVESLDLSAVAKPLKWLNLCGMCYNTSRVSDCITMLLRRHNPE